MIFQWNFVIPELSRSANGLAVAGDAWVLNPGSSKQSFTRAF
jgi:hypothetical protein